MIGLKSGMTVAHFEAAEIAREFARAEFRFHQVVPPRRSFELRVFLGEPDATATTSTSGNPHYIGSEFFYGVGPGGASPEENNDSRDPQQFASIELRLNVTDRLRRLLAIHPVGVLPLSLVAVDRRGGEIEDPGLSFESVSIVTS